MAETLEQRLRRIADTLNVQGSALADLEKGEEASGSNLRNLQKELADLKRAAQSTPQFVSRAQPVVIGTASSSGILTPDVEKAIASRLAGLSSSEDLYKSLGLIRRRYD
jgi:hypothetical protein